MSQTVINQTNDDGGDEINFSKTHAAVQRMMNNDFLSFILFLKLSI